MTAFQTPTYADLINADGSFNRGAIMRVAAARARHERNVAIVVDSGAASRLPARILYADVRDEYAALAAGLLRPVSVQPWSVFFGRELREVWQIARIAKARFDREAVARAAKAPVFAEAA